jgi:hypothetical protein
MPTIVCCRPAATIGCLHVRGLPLRPASMACLYGLPLPLWPASTSTVCLHPITIIIVIVYFLFQRNTYLSLLYVIYILSSFIS